MTTFDDELLQDAEEDARTVEFIKNYMPQELKERFTDDELYYFLDVIISYYATSGVLDQAPDAEGFIDIDQDAVVNYVIDQARKDKMGEYAADDVLWVVQGEMEYSEQLDEE